MYVHDSNFYAIIATAILHFIIGAFWYSPLLFGNSWLELTGLKKEDLKGTAQAYIGGFIIAFLVSYAVSHFVHATNALTVIEGALVGWWAWLGFIATTHFSGVLWEKRPLKLFLINVSVLLIVLVLTGGILAVWR